MVRRVYNTVVSFCWPGCAARALSCPSRSHDACRCTVRELALRLAMEAGSNVAVTWRPSAGSCFLRDLNLVRLRFGQVTQCQFRRAPSYVWLASTLNISSACCTSLHDLQRSAFCLMMLSCLLSAGLSHMCGSDEFCYLSEKNPRRLGVLCTFKEAQRTWRRLRLWCHIGLEAAPYDRVTEHRRPPHEQGTYITQCPALGRRRLFGA
jgi:hypothetical protein